MPIEALAVAGHHRPLDTDLTSFEREKVRIEDVPLVYEDGVRYAIDLAQNIFKREGWELPVISEKLAKTNGLKKLSELLNSYMPKLIEEESDRSKKLVFSNERDFALC